MFGTIIIDAYEKSEAPEIANALNDLCNPKDSLYWSSAGIYCFWDYYTKEIYYIGLATDLTLRFKQHNGLIRVNKKSCKITQIENYFKNNKKIGYTIFVQSPMSQTINARNKKIYSSFKCEPGPIKNYIGNIGKEHMKDIEGIFIEVYKKVHEEFPLWNKIGGSKAGQDYAVIEDYDIIKNFTNTQLYPLIARCSLRELSSNSEYLAYETELHAIRQQVLNTGSSFDFIIDVHKRFGSPLYYNDIIKNDYLNKQLNL